MEIFVGWHCDDCGELVFVAFNADDGEDPAELAEAACTHPAPAEARAFLVRALAGLYPVGDSQP